MDVQFVWSALLTFLKLVTINEELYLQMACSYDVDYLGASFSQCPVSETYHLDGQEVF